MCPFYFYSFQFIYRGCARGGSARASSMAARDSVRMETCERFWRVLYLFKVLCFDIY